MQKSLAFFIVLIGLLFLPQSTYAHFLATDKQIGAVIHVTPNDEPVAGLESSFFFDFKDEENKFKSSDCDCTFIIKESGKTIYSHKIFQNQSEPNLTKASVTYTFPQKDIYQVQIVGKPEITNEFQPFTLSWDFRIDQQADPQTVANQGNAASKYLRYAIIFGSVAALILVIFFMRGGGKHNEENSRNQY